MKKTLLAIMAGFPLLLGACASNSPSTSQPDESVIPYTFKVPDGSEAEPLAALEGALIIEGKCIYVKTNEGDQRPVILSEKGKPKVKGDILEFFGKSFKAGTAVTFGGAADKNLGTAAECKGDEYMYAYNVSQ